MRTLLRVWPWVIGLIALSAFGPYIVGPVRTEQAVVYALVPFALLTAGGLVRRRWAVPIVLLWSTVIGFSVVGFLFVHGGLLFFPPGAWLASLDNLLLPLGIMLIVWALMPREAYPSSLRAVARVVVWASALNGVLAAATSLRPELAALLGSFWTGSGGEVRGGVSVGANSMIMGRYAGIFGQPAEAGAVYSLALILAVWLYRARPFKLYTSLGLISLGGVLSVSKIFLFVGVPVMAVLALLLLRGWHRVGLLLGVSGLVLIALGSGFFAQWDGLDYLLRFFSGQGTASGLSLITANRWSQGSFTFDILQVVASESFLVGAGLRGLDVPVDSQLTEVVTLAGYLGALLMAGALMLVAAAVRRIPDRSLRRVGLAVWFVAVGAAFGLPVLTGNRTATVFWLVMTLLVGLSTSGRRLEKGWKRG